MHKNILTFTLLFTTYSSIFSIFNFSPSFGYEKNIIFEVSGLSPVFVSDIVAPKSVKELKDVVLSSSKPIAFAGGRFSQGGQIAYPQGISVDTTKLNKVLFFDPKAMVITVEPGIKWFEIQKIIDRYDLSINVMQSYIVFTVGGSLSVNVHGRGSAGSLIKTIDSIKVLIADGSIVKASRDENSDLFYAVIGGYGLLGAIVETTLNLTKNEKIEQVSKSMSLSEYSNYFFTHIKNNDQVIFHNANIYPNEFDSITAFSWYKTDNPLTTVDRLRKQDKHTLMRLEGHLLQRIPLLNKVRKKIDTNEFKRPEVVWRNYEMSHTVNSIEPFIRFPTTNILQEYFVPVDQLVAFMDQFQKIVNRHGVNVLNVSIRHVPKDTESILAYAPKESFALVCYMNVPTTIKQHKEHKWTQNLIDAVLAVGGTFYLPYHLYARPEQFMKAYPRFNELLETKQKYDPRNKFINSLYKAYIEG